MRRMAWQRVAVPTVAFFQEGPGLRSWQWTDKGMKVINGTNIRDDGRFDPSNTTRAISLEEFKAKYQHFAIDANDIVVASSGTLGKAARVKAEHLPMMMNTSVIRFRASDRARLDDGFLYAWLRSRDFLDQALGMATGAAQQNFGPSHVKQMTLPLPAIGEQRRIAAILSAYDELIENNTRRIAILEELSRRIYEEWFVRFRFPGHEGVRMVESELGLVPATWRVLPMSAVAEVIDCLHSKKPTEREDGAGLMLQLFNIAEDGILDLTKRFRVSAEDYSLWTSRMEAQEGDCVITNVGRVGAVAQIPQGVKAALGRNMTGVRAKQGAISPTYLLRYLLSSHMESEVVKKKDPGTIMDSLNVKGIVRLSVPVADAHTMQAFDRAAAPMRRQVEVLVLKNVNLRKTRDLLLPKLISGELDVSAMSEPEALAA